MTDEEFSKELNKLDATIEEYKCELDHANDAKKELVSNYCDELTARYKDFDGKLVSIETRSRWSSSRSTKEGFFGGFFMESSFGKVSICPVLYKSKKDGSASKNRFTSYDVGSYDENFKISCIGEK